MFKITLIILILLLFNGCSQKENYLYKNQPLIFKKVWFKNNIIKPNTTTKEILQFDKELFTDNIKEDNTIYNINENYLINQNIIYTNLKTAYKYVLLNQNINGINLKSYDYLKLYKALRLSQNKLFKHIKNEIIKKFMIEIENKINLDNAKIYLVLKNEKIEKINQLIKLLEKENK